MNELANPSTSRSFMLTGPRPRGALPVRGDLAHIALAGQVFVPHYAVPVAYRTVSPVAVLAAAHDGAEHLADLPAAAMFDVLDIAGRWAWGQLAGNGPVGYVALEQLEKAE